jgi:uncharacterized membrane protein YedE/YeeE
MNLSSLAGPIVGGLLIGGAAVALLYFNGRILGISGLAGGLVDGPASERGVRVSFLAGLSFGAVALVFTMPAAYGRSPASLPVLAVAGLLVGFGTRLGNGCTSGHGVCGNSRLSARSLVSTLVFIAVGMLTVAAVRKLGGAS